MRPVPHRPFVLIQTLDQWLRCAHRQTVVDPLDGTVELAPIDSVVPEASETEALPVAGLAFDRHCRLFRSVPELGHVFMHRWSMRGADLRAELDPVPDDRDGQPLFAAHDAGPLGEFVSIGAESGPLRRPTGLAVDGRDRLYVWEAETGTLLIWDLDRGALLRRIQLGFVGPVDLAWIGDRLIGVGPQLPGVLSLGADGRARLRPFPSGFAGQPARVAGDSRGRMFVLVDAGSEAARVVALDDGGATISIPGASELVFLSASEGADGDRFERLIVARGPGQMFAQYVLGPSGISDIEPLAARGYDGRGIARTPDDRVIFFGTRGLRHAVKPPLRYARVGRVISFRLDAGEFQARWGRIFVDACVGRGTELRVATYVSDDPPDAQFEDLPIDRTPPDNVAAYDLVDPRQPPMPPGSRVPAQIVGRLVERALGPELPWTQRDANDRRRFRTWESVVEGRVGEPTLGRYLWVFLELRGDGRRTPRVRSLRVERVGHGLLNRLPRIYSRDPVAADFLWRFLALFDGLLVGLELRAIVRHALFDPRSTPESFLPWLAGMLGMAVDQRWPDAALRRAISEASWLFRFRGTVPGLRRLLELYLGEGTVVIVEHFRLRGFEDPSAAAIVGGGFRVGGMLGVDELVELGTGAHAIRHAHRFSVVILAVLDRRQREIVEHILEQHRPAHTLYELCTIDSGLRVGLGLHVGMSSVVGAGSGWTRWRLGASCLGGDALIGEARVGLDLGSARVGEDSRVS